MPHTCPDGESLFLYAEGLLEPVEHDRVATHLKTCPGCRERVRQESELTVSLRQLPVPEPSYSLVAGVRGRILAGERRRRASRWWWVVAVSFLVASGLRWLVAADLSFDGAVAAVVELLVFIVRSPLVAVGWLSDPETWEAVATVLTSTSGAVASSPVMLTLVIVASLLVAAATNLLIFGVARRLVRG